MPDLVVEIVSPTDSYGEVDDKVARYLEDGVRLIWVINPRTRTIHVYTPGSERFERLTADDILDGGEVVRGFSVVAGVLW